MRARPGCRGRRRRVPAPARADAPNADLGPRGRDDPAREFNTATGDPVYFCYAYSPWQRGSNENSNGVLRQYNPKKTELPLLGSPTLDAVVDELSHRPGRAEE
jgi:hypothetical protein